MGVCIEVTARTVAYKKQPTLGPVSFRLFAFSKKLKRQEDARLERVLHPLRHRGEDFLRNREWGSAKTKPPASCGPT